MLDTIKRIPAGTFLVPMLVSAFLYTFWPDLFQLGGLTQHIFGGAGTNGLIGAIIFISGTGIDIKKVGYALKRQGVIFLVKLLLGIGVSLLYMHLFGQNGIFGVSALAFTITILSINPAVYLSLMQQYGSKEDTSVYGLTGLFSVAAFPMIVYGLASGGGINWMPVISTIIPMIAGMILGNLDRKFTNFLMPALPGLTFLMGWNLGYGLNLVESFQAGLGGIIVTIMFYLVNLVMIPIDHDLLHNDGTVGATCNTVAGLSVSSAGILGSIYPDLLGPYVNAAASQILLAVVVTGIITPIIVAKLSNHGAHSYS